MGTPDARRMGVTHLRGALSAPLPLRIAGARAVDAGPVGLRE